jgi:DNA polymerase
MGALEQGLTEDELPDIVSRWRDANRRIARAWYAVDAAAIGAARSGEKRWPAIPIQISFERRLTPLDALVVTLPSGRELWYLEPELGTGTFGRECLRYMGTSQTNRQWSRMDTFGGKLVENLTQSIARDVLADLLTRLRAEGLPVVAHVHDEVILEVSEAQAEGALAKTLEMLSIPPAWARGLPLKGDGSILDYYSK